MRRKHIQNFVNDYLLNHVSKEDIMVDATMGNGFDTVFLSKISKHVYAFDIQDEALISTGKKIEDERITNVTLIKDSFIHIRHYVDTYKGVVFNLGYLPGGDKQITTQTDITTETLKILSSHMNKDTFIILTCYPGHDEGHIESRAILAFTSQLDDTYSVIQYHLLNKKNKPPFVVVIEKH